ncbi:hypothetical protein E3N88_30596 [Mikania micrantha]|uniref:Uncharacterized protein n=1 Tax=Mikania micrantha TaxID=192012 RepID=A0A5N6MMU8_9ASTR|nr:hypothetical protein E3N88_30596 [Mikania micrantha]
MIIKFGGKLGWEIYVAILLKDESIQATTNERVQGIGHIAVVSKIQPPRHRVRSAVGQPEQWIWRIPNFQTSDNMKSSGFDLGDLLFKIYRFTLPLRLLRRRRLVFFIVKVQARILLLKSLRTDYDKNASRNKRQNDGLRLSQDIKGGVVLRVREATCAGHVVIKEPGEMILIIREIFSCLIGKIIAIVVSVVSFVVLITAASMLDLPESSVPAAVSHLQVRLNTVLLSLKRDYTTPAPKKLTTFVEKVRAAVSRIQASSQPRFIKEFSSFKASETWLRRSLDARMIIKFEGKLGWEIYVAIMLKDIQDRFPALSLLSVFLVWKTKKWILLGNKLKTSLERNIGEKLRPKVPFCSNFSFNFKWSQIFVWIITLKWSGIPFPLTVTNAYCHRPTVVNIRQPPVVSWGLVHEEYLFPAGANRSISLFNKGLTRLLNRPHGLPCSADGSNSEVDNSITLKDVRIKIRKWADKQWLPVGAAGYAISCGLQMFIWCFFSKIVQECIFPGEFSEFESYYPFFISLMTSPLISACTGAILMTSSAFIAYVIERMRGKESYELKQIVGGLGGGVIVALCTGMRDPFSVFSFGVFWALIYGLSAKLVPDTCIALISVSILSYTF